RQEDYLRKLEAIRSDNQKWQIEIEAKTSKAWYFLLGWWGILLLTHGKYTMLAFWAGVLVSTATIGKWLIEDYRHRKDHQDRIDQLEKNS
ncbi:MAG: hypothetical protein ACOYNN_15620, partial [Terrimicrobiaceae bacterium]